MQTRRRLLGLLTAALIPSALKAEQITAYPIGRDGTRMPTIGPEPEPLNLPICDHKWKDTLYGLLYCGPATMEMDAFDHDLSVQVCEKCGVLRCKALAIAGVPGKPAGWR